MAMNLDVTCIAVNSRVRSPVAAAPKRSWSCRTCLEAALDGLDLGTALHVPGERDEVGAWWFFVGHFRIFKSVQ